MTSINLLRCYGTKKVTKNWNYDTPKGINRLYFIHSGNGGYLSNGIYHSFVPQKLYFFPYTVEYSLFSDSEDGICHTYADFELIPPVISPHIIECEPDETDSLAAKALEVFLGGGTVYLKQKSSEPEFLKLCFSAIEYLVMFAIKKSPQTTVVTDAAVIFSLEMMLSHIAEPLTVDDLAKANYLSTDYFIRRFKKSMGTTPYSYLKQLRIRTARYFLSAGKNLGETAAAVGYSDGSSLLHAMKRSER